MRLRVRKASQQPSATPPVRTTKAKRKHSEVEHTRSSGGAAMQKSDTGIFSTIKRFIRGNAVKVWELFHRYHFCIYNLYAGHCNEESVQFFIFLIFLFSFVKIFNDLKSAHFIQTRWSSVPLLRGAVWIVTLTVTWSHPPHPLGTCPAELTLELAEKVLPMEVS